MRSHIKQILMAVAVVCACGGTGAVAKTEAPFHRGVNLTNWLQGRSVRQIQFTRFTKQDFVNIKSLGCDVIRLPIDLHSMTDGAPNYTVDPLFLSLLDIAADFQNQRQVPVFCGEFGVYRLTSKDEHRVYWYSVVRQYLEAKGMSWTSWDYQGGFGLFQVASNELFEHDLNVPLVEALGLTAPKQTPLVVTPERTGFSMYDDAIAWGMSNATWIQQGTVGFYCAAGPAEGAYCLYCTGLARYNHITFDFRPDKDLTLLVQGGSALQLWVRGDTPNASVEVRFVDTKTSDPRDHPWRMGTAIDSAIVRWDGEWHQVRIPLKNLQDRGAWDSAWFNPPGAFDWAAADWFQIVAEYHDFVGVQFWFDGLRVTDPTARFR